MPSEQAKRTGSGVARTQDKTLAQPGAQLSAGLSLDTAPKASVEGVPGEQLHS